MRIKQGFFPHFLKKFWNIALKQKMIDEKKNKKKNHVCQKRGGYSFTKIHVVTTLTKTLQTDHYKG